jgi:hypothetical protein
MTQHTPGPWERHIYSTPTPVALLSDDTTFTAATICFGVGDKLLGDIRYQTGAKGFPHVESIAEFEANARLVIAAPTLMGAIMKVVDATRAYLPPDGISKEELINLVLEATDNPEMAAIIDAHEGREPFSQRQELAA